MAADLTNRQIGILLFVDIILVLIHFLFGLLISQEVFTGLISSCYTFFYPNSVVPSHYLVLGLIASHISTFYWILTRLAADYEISVFQLMRKFSVFEVKISKTAVFVCCMHVLGLGIIALLQTFIGKWTFTLENIAEQTKLVDMWVLAPLREEIAFRFVMFHTIYRRLGSSPTLFVPASFLTNIIFGVIHMLNLFGSKFSADYIGLQCGLGVIVGLFYSMRARFGFWEVFSMHFVNNVCASFLPFLMEIEWSDLSFLVPLIMSLVVYNVLILQDVYLINVSNNAPKELESKKPKDSKKLT